MEYGLWHLTNDDLQDFDEVLILVVMEDGLWLQFIMATIFRNKTS